MNWVRILIGIVTAIVPLPCGAVIVDNLDQPLLAGLVAVVMVSIVYVGFRYDELLKETL